MVKKLSNNQEKKFSRKASKKDLEVAILQERFAKSITVRINDHSDDQLGKKALKQIDIQFLRFIQDINKLYYPFKDKELGMEAHRSKEEIIFRNETESFIPEAERVRHIQRYEHS